MKRKNLTYLAIIPMIAGIVLMSCNSKSSSADNQSDTLRDSDSLVAENIVLVDTNDTVYTRCDTIPQFEGGLQAFINATLKNLKFPEVSSRYQCSGIYHFDLIVEKDGKVYNAHLVKKEKVKLVVPDSIDYNAAMEVVDLANIEAVRAAVKEGPACEPAKVNGAPVRFALRVPINLVLQPAPDQQQASK